MKKFYVTTPIYYVNAKPHIGSAYTTIAADVIARYHRQKGDDVFFLTGTAEHGTKMANYAAEAGKDPRDFVDANSALFKEAWRNLNISHDHFVRTTDPNHEEAVKEFFVSLQKSGKIYAGEYAGLYCVGHEAFIKESELDEQGLCADHKTAPQKIKEKNWFFKLSEYALTLKKLIASDVLVIRPPGRKKEVLSFIEQGLEDISISRQNVEWAIPLPWDETQTIYVWLDELFNYCSAIGYGQDEATFKRYWPADLHLIGKDIIKFHAVIWPALLLAVGLPLPKQIFAHGYFTVNGQKMSKSLGNVIDPVAVAAEYGVDALRYFILRDIPFGSDGDVSLDRLKERYNADLANGLGNLVSRALTMIEQFAPDFNPAEKQELPPEISSTLASVDGYIENLALDKALTAMWEAMRWADGLIEETKPWELAKRGDTEEVEKTLSDVYSVLVAVNTKLAPFMPATSEKLALLLSSRPLKKPTEPLFKRK